jgi:hypothetical protein
MSKETVQSMKWQAMGWTNRIRFAAEAPVPGSTQPHIQDVFPVLSTEVKRPEHEAGHSQHL